MSITYFTGGYAQAPVQTLTTTKGQSFAYRALGAPGSVPIVALVHLAANLDNWDPQLLDLLAAGRPIIAVDYAGVGKSTGTAGTTVKNMAEGIIEFLDAAGLETVDLLGLSLGGFVVQQLLLDAPHRFRKAILAGTGPAGGVGITRVPLLTFQAMLRSFIKRRDPKYYLFFQKVHGIRQINSLTEFQVLPIQILLSVFRLSCASSVQFMLGVNNLHKICRTLSTQYSL